MANILNQPANKRDDSRRCIAVLGMHRSGTSLLMRGMLALGAGASKEMIAPQYDNPSGFWEDRRIVKINERILSMAGSSWHHCTPPIIPLDSGQAQILLREAIEIVSSEIEQHSLWAFKDPRSIRLMAFWKKVLDLLDIHTAAVLVIRNPLSVAQSLAMRDKFSLQHSLLLWLSYYLSAWNDVSPIIKITINYDDFIKFPYEQLRKMAHKLNIKENEATTREFISKYLDRKLCHSYFNDNDLNGNPVVIELVKETYSALQKLVTNCMDPDARQILSESSVAFYRLLPVLQYIDEQQESLWRVGKDLSEKDNTLSKEQKEKEELQRHLDNSLREHTAQVQLLEQDLQKLRTELHSLLYSRSWRLTRPLRVAGSSLRAMRSVALFISDPCLIPQRVRKAYWIWRHKGMYTLLSAIKKKDRSSVLNDYERWLFEYDTPTRKQQVDMQEIIAGFTIKPTISVVMPVYNTPERYLVEAIESVRSQVYPYWELCIADDASDASHIKKILNKYKKLDSRIKVIFRNSNGHISAACNSALSLATGQYVGFLDHDDVLSSEALYWIAVEINKHPDGVLFYSDEDKIDEIGNRYSPYFKPDWNPELFLSQNLITHFAVYLCSSLEKVGGFREGFEGSQDYDLAARVSESCLPNQIYHIPKILYHWRAISGSTARGGGEKDYAAKAGRKVIAEHLLRRGISGEVVAAPGFAPNSTLQRVRFALPNPLPMVSILIPTKNNKSLLETAISSILEKSTYSNYQIVVIDNGSSDLETVKYLQSLKEEQQVHVIQYPYPFNFSAIINFAAAQSRGDILCLLNDDTEVISCDWLEEMVSLASQPKIGAVGAKLYYPDNTIQHAGVILGIAGWAGHAHRHFPSEHPGYFGRAKLLQNYSAVTGACLVVRKELYQLVGGLDEENFTVAFNDVDFCLKLLSAGYRNVFTPYAELYHYESASRGYEDTSEKKARFQKEANALRERWGELLDSDPAYNKNLTLDREDFSLAWPPRHSNCQL